MSLAALDIELHHVKSGSGPKKSVKGGHGNRDNRSVLLGGGVDPVIAMMFFAAVELAPCYDVCHRQLVKYDAAVVIGRHIPAQQ
jgi:hypothetical protein